jgi:hypothetical protein
MSAKKKRSGQMISQFETQPYQNTGSPLVWTPSRSDGVGVLRANREGVEYEIAEAFGDFVLWVGKNGKNGLVAISADRDSLKREADIFANQLVPYAAGCGLDLASLVIANSDHMATLWTLLSSPDFRTSEVQDGVQPKEK